MEPEVTLTDVIRRHLTMGLAIKDAFTAEQSQELSRFSKLATKSSKSKQSKKKNNKKGNLDDVTKEEVPQTVPFKTLLFLHATLKKHFNEASKEVEESLEKEGAENESRPCAYIHELLRGSSLHIPELPKPERNPELEARCQRLRLEQQEKAYQNMVRAGILFQEKYSESLALFCPFHIYLACPMPMRILLHTRSLT